jgi:hypothetical protein
MMIKATGRSALILATGIFVCLAGPSQAATGTDTTTASAKPESAAPVVLSKYAKHSAHHGKSYAHRKSSAVAQKPSDKKDSDKKDLDKKDLPTDAAAGDNDTSSAIPPTVANANAQMAPTQMAATDVPGGNAKAMSARASEILAMPAGAQTNVDAQVVAADQLNDVDRALHEGSPPALVLASADTQATAPVMASSSGNDGSTWDQTSLIGKIFIGFGALLTMASAARMFMA